MQSERDPGSASAPAERRVARRQRVDVGVLLYAGRLVLSGRAVNLSRQGVAVALADPPRLDGAAPDDPTAGVRGLQRALVGGAVVQFRVSPEIRIPARLVRPSSGTAADATPVLGLRLARPLADDEWARLAIAPAAATPEPLRPVRRESPMEFTLVDPARGAALRLAVLAAAATTLKGSFVGPAVDPVTLRERCGGARRSARIDAGREILWIGTATLHQFYGGIVPPTARFHIAPPLPPAVLARLEPPSRGG